MPSSAVGEAVVTSGIASVSARGMALARGRRLTGGGGRTTYPPRSGTSLGGGVR